MRHNYKRKPKRINTKKGFTLVEMIVTLVIAVIIIAISSSFIITGTNIFSRSAQRDIQFGIAEGVLDFVSNQLLFANAVSEEEEAPGPDCAVMRLTDPAGSAGGSGGGQLFFRRVGDDGELVNIFGAGFYHGYSVSMACEITEATEEQGAFFELTTSLYDSKNPTKELITRTTTKPLLNYRGSSKALGGNDNFILIGYPGMLYGSGPETKADSYRVAMAVVAVLGEYGKDLSEASMGSFYSDGNGATGVLDPEMLGKVAEKAGLAGGSAGFAETAENWYIDVRKYNIIIHFTDAASPGIDQPGGQKLWDAATAGQASTIWLCVLVGDDDYYRIKLKG